MKRLWVVFLALCTVAMSFAGISVAGAEETNTDVWSIYSLKEDSNGIPYFATAPSYAYTEKGLQVTPSVGTNTYTVQTDHAYYMDQGIYMEFTLDIPDAVGLLIFHLWDQNGMLVNNFHCGSGMQYLIQLDGTGNMYMMSAALHGSKGGDEGGVVILGNMKLNALTNAEGRETYTLELKDGILRINGSIVAGMDDAMTYLHEIRPDGSVYVGVSVVTGEQNEPIPITVTRFGASADTAFVPGTTGDLPETGEASDETVAQGPVETEPSQGSETSAPAPETTPDVETAATPGENGDPTESRPADHTDESDPEEVTTDDFKSPFEQTEEETKKEIHNDAVDGFLDQMDGLVSKGCGATLSAGALGILTLLAAAYVGTRKKD